MSSPTYMYLLHLNLHSIRDTKSIVSPGSGLAKGQSMVVMVATPCHSILHLGLKDIRQGRSKNVCFNDDEAFVSADQYEKGNDQFTENSVPSESWSTTNSI